MQMGGRGGDSRSAGEIVLKIVLFYYQTNLSAGVRCLKNLFHQNFRKWPQKKVKNKDKNQLISAKQPDLIITRNGFDIIVN